MDQQATAPTAPRARRLRRALIGVGVGAVVIAAGAGWKVDSLRSTARDPASVTITAVSPDEAARSGVVSFHGADYAYDESTDRIVVCDEERDGRPVKVEYETADGRIRHLFDVSEAAGDCTAVDPGPAIVRHRVCEANLTWTCLNWQSTEKTVTPSG